MTSSSFLKGKAKISRRGLGLLFVGSILGVFLFPQLLSTLTQESKDPLVLLVVGDMMFDRDIRRIGETLGYKYLWGDYATVLQDVDLLVGNLEGPVTSYKSVSAGTKVGSPDNTRFTFSSNALQAFPEVQTAVNLGNNHILDFGKVGVLSTKEALQRQGISFFGDIVGEDDISVVIEQKGIRVALISYNQFLGNGLEEVLAAIQKEAALSSFVIVYAHWGTEYVSKMPPYLKDRAKQFIDAGADMVLGSHPHVVGESFSYKGNSVYYSLGNFIFDQYWDKSVRCGVALKIVLTHAQTIKIESVATSFSNNQVQWGNCK